jgi:antitoxin (DNA-binding transcriptional repressor) of toxin-antitoxin stability system
LLEVVETGEEVVIAHAGKPVAILTAYRPPRNKIAPPGGMEGEIWMADDFDAPIDDLFDCLKDNSDDPLNSN